MIKLHLQLINKAWDEFIMDALPPHDGKVIDFIQYVNGTYGVLYSSVDVSAVITDEEKYMMFLLRFG